MCYDIICSDIYLVVECYMYLYVVVEVERAVLEVVVVAVEEVLIGRNRSNSCITVLFVVIGNECSSNCDSI
jgi:hypothetical protein